MVANLRQALILCLVMSLGSISGYTVAYAPSRKSFSSTKLWSFSGAQQSFNPFSSRTRNKNIQWFEADLETFYRFVEQQPLLTNEQEVQYGKALRMWQKIEQLREKMQSIREQATQNSMCDTKEDISMRMEGLRMARDLG